MTKTSLKALCTGVVLIAINMFSGSFALINYMTTIFAATHTELLDPGANTIIIGVVQIIGAYSATTLVDRFGRKILLMVSTGKTEFFNN